MNNTKEINPLDVLAYYRETGNLKNTGKHFTIGKDRLKSVLAEARELERKQEEEFNKPVLKDSSIIDLSTVDLSKIDTSPVGKMIDIDDPDPEKVEQAHKDQEEIIELIRETSKAIQKLGKLLIPFNEERKWAYLGYSSFQEWYQGMGISKSTIYRAMGIYKTFVMDYGIPEDTVYSCDTRKLDRLLPLQKKRNDEGELILNSDNAEDWLSKATEMSEGDFIDEINESRGHKTPVQELEEQDILSRGTYVLVRSEENVGDLERLSDVKIPMELYRDEDGRIVVRVI